MTDLTSIEMPPFDPDPDPIATEFPCPQEGCDRVFPSAQALQGHFNFHNRPKPEKVPCPDCGEMFFSGTGMSQHRKARHNPDKVADKQVKKQGRPRKDRIDLELTTDDLFQTVVEVLWPGGNVPVSAVLPLIQWRETTREFLEKVRSE